MPITSSGEISLIADIEAEFNQTGDTDISLFQARDDAGLSDGQIQLTDFYGLSDAVASTVQTNSSSSITSSSMTANGNVTNDGGGTISSRGFYFGTNSTYSNNTKYTVSGTTGSFSRSFTGLSSGTTYYATAFAVNQVGESVGVTRSSSTSVPAIISSASISVSGWSGSGYFGTSLPVNYARCGFSSGSAPSGGITVSGYGYGAGITNINRWWVDGWSGYNNSSNSISSGQNLNGKGLHVSINQTTYLYARTIGHGCTFSSSGYASGSLTTHTCSITT